MDITFNTGRLYTKEGQVIRAVWDKEAEKVHFNDFSRMVCGSFNVPTTAIEFSRPHVLAAWVWEKYGNCEYHYTEEATALTRDRDVIPFRVYF